MCYVSHINLLIKDRMIWDLQALLSKVGIPSADCKSPSACHRNHFNPASNIMHRLCTLGSMMDPLLADSSAWLALIAEPNCSQKDFALLHPKNQTHTPSLS